MIAIPMTKKVSWRNPPMMTIIIILVNIFVFIVIQGGDDEHYLEAESFYFESGLDQIEIPLYLEFIENHRPEMYRKFSTIDGEPGLSETMWLYHTLNYDGGFLDSLKNGRIGIESLSEKRRHRLLRRDFENLREKIVSLQYGFQPARPKPMTWLTTMFLHGGIGHLVGNMIFLWLIGCLIEIGCRRWLFVVIYGLGGFCATGFFWWLNMKSLIPLIGASGAISGIMGAFTVLYGFKRVRIFLSLGFYFNYVKFPAIAMLPFWIGNEIFQMIYDQGSSIAYAAHMGGLAGGAIIAFLVRRIPHFLDIDAFEDAQNDDPVQQMIEKALTHMGKLEFAEARKELVAADEIRPGDKVILSHLFTIDRQEPNTPQFHRTSQKLLSCLCQQPKTYTDVHRVYLEYIRLVRPAKLEPSLFLHLARVFCELGELDDAQRLLAFLAKKRLDLEQVPAILLKLAGLQAKKGNQQARNACLTCLRNHYPMTSEARIAIKHLGSATAR